MSDLFQSVVFGAALRGSNVAADGRRTAATRTPAGAAEELGQRRPSVSHAADPPHANVNFAAEGQATPPAHTTPSVISDVDNTAESPQEERDEVNVLNELIGGGYAIGGFPIRSWLRRPAGSGSSYASLRSWGESVDDRMSANPAHEVAESLRSTDSLASLHDNAQSPADTPGTRPRVNIRRDSGMQTGEGEEDVVQHVRQEPSAMDTSLPPDDGMRSLREKMHEIRMLAVSTEEKARRMHAVMTQSYISHKAEHGLASSTEEPAVSEFAPPIDPANPYNIHPKDLEPSFSPLPVAPPQGSTGQDESMEEDTAPVLGCRHYKRNVKVQCFDCHRWFPCRHCHDQALDLPFPHQLNRKRTQNMLCMFCQTPQPAAEVCANCDEYASWYYCPKCKLWDNDSNKRIYHCDDCGICRVGEGLGRDFVHCRRCNVCISISTSASHPCIERATEGDCPLCLVRLFESSTPVVSLPCGHYMHGECYRDLMAVTYKCPVCSKSAVNMELQWRKLDDEIQLQPMPEEDEDIGGLLPLTDNAANGEEGVMDGIDTSSQASSQQPPRRPREVWIGCNDCGSRCWTPFHWLGLKCQVCDSYNTVQMAPTQVQETDAERVIRQQQQYQHRQHDFTGNAVLRDIGIGADDQVTEQVQEPLPGGLEVPTSPSLAPGSPRSGGRASGAQSPGRRYFVQEEEQRRPSFTSTPRFSTSSIPTLPNLPEMPRLPRMPTMPNLPNMPHLPNMPNLDLPRLRGNFSPYDMFDAVSRSLSPMRYYLQGLDMWEGDVRGSGSGGRNRSPTSVHSDPTTGVSSSKRKAPDTDDEAVEFWGSDGQFLSGEEDDSDDSIHAVGRDDESSSESETSDAEMADDDDDDDDGEGGDEGVDMELFGHR